MREHVQQHFRAVCMPHYQIAHNKCNHNSDIQLTLSPACRVTAILPHAWRPLAGAAQAGAGLPASLDQKRLSLDPCSISRWKTARGRALPRSTILCLLAFSRVLPMPTLPLFCVWLLPPIAFVFFSPRGLRGRLHSQLGSFAPGRSSFHPFSIEGSWPMRGGKLSQTNTAVWKNWLRSQHVSSIRSFRFFAMQLPGGDAPNASPEQTEPLPRADAESSSSHCGIVGGSPTARLPLAGERLRSRPSSAMVQRNGRIIALQAHRSKQNRHNGFQQ